MLGIEEIETTFPKESRLTGGAGFVKVQEYLLARGISTETIDRAGIQIVPAKRLFERTYDMQSFDDRMAVVFKHFDTHGNPIPWWSARLVEVVERSRVVNRGKMFCPPHQAPHGYLSPLTNFQELKEGDTIYIHESCIKALNGSLLGFHSIGLNGVFGFTSRKHKVELVEEIRDLPWKSLSLKCVIVFDSNAADNANIQYAISSLAERMYRLLGVECTHILLPRSPEDVHWGFDDFVVRHGREAARDFLLQEGKPVELGEIEQLKAKLSAEVAVVNSLGRIAVQETGSLMNKSVFTDVVYAHYTAKIEKDNGIKIINVPKMWLMDERRTTVERIDYMPGQPRIHDNALNLWSGMGVLPADGEIQPFFELLVNNINDERIVRWLFQWLAYPLQNMGGKLNTYVHAFGPSGVGKNMMLRPLERIYGRNFVTISKENMDSQFNSVYAGKQLVHIDELHTTDRISAVKLQQKLKMLTTGETVIVNQKGQPEYSIKNYANIITTSNYYDSLKLDEDDRRACVIKFENLDDKRGDQEYWLEYIDWCDNGGAEALYDYLLKYDLSDFDPKGWAPMTIWKGLVADASRSPMERWVYELRDAPDETLPMNYTNRCLFQTKELAILYYGLPENELKKGQIDQLALMLRNAGFAMANDGRAIKVNGMPIRLWVVRQREKDWDSDMVQKHLKAIGK